MKKYAFLLLTVIFLDACSSSRNWKGTSNLRSTQAEFEELNGRQAFTLLVPDHDTYLKYNFMVNSGTIEATIKSPEAVVMRREMGESEADSVHVVNQKGTKYKIYLKGKQASGRFDIKFVDVVSESK